MAAWGLISSVPGITQEGIPLLVPISYSTSSGNKILTLESQYPWYYTLYDIQGHYIGQWFTPGGPAGQKTTIIDLTVGYPLINYPTYVSIDFVDAASGLTLNTQRIQLVGGDTFKVVLTFPVSNPSQNNMLVNIDGVTQMIPTSLLGQTIWQHGDVHTPSQQ